MEFNVSKIRRDFPALDQTMRGGGKLVYFDNAATAQKPRSVVDAVSNFYLRDNANIHRSAHELSDRATIAYERARNRVLEFANAPDGFTAVFTRGTTEALNIVGAGEFEAGR